MIKRPSIRLSLQGAMAIAYMALVPMSLCYVSWAAAIKRVPVSAASTGLLIVPVVGAVSAAAVIGEPLGLREILAAALTLGGAALACCKDPRERATARLSRPHER